MAKGLPDFQIPINISAQTLATLAVDIAAQTIGNLGVNIKAQDLAALAIDIAAQTLSALDINITAQDLSELVIKIAAQSVGVYLQPEWAALQGIDKDFHKAFRNIPAGLNWVLPTGYNDPDGKWFDEPKVYDNNTATYAYGDLLYFLELTIAAVVCDRIRFIPYTSVADGIIDLDAYYNNAWHDVYEGTFTAAVWNEKELGGEYSVTKARVQFKNPGGGTARLYELSFLRLEYSNYIVPIGKALYLTQIGFSISGSADVDKDKDQMGWVRIYDATDQSSKLEMGGNGGNFASLAKPIVIDAEHEVRFYWYNRANHTCDGSISIDGYEI